MYFASFIFQMHKMHTAQCSRMQPPMHRLKIGLIVKGWTVYILSCIIWRFHSRSKCKNWLCEYIQMTRNCKFAWAKSNGRLWCIRRCVWSGMYIFIYPTRRRLHWSAWEKLCPMILSLKLIWFFHCWIQSHDARVEADHSTFVDIEKLNISNQ